MNKRLLIYLLPCVFFFACSKLDKEPQGNTTDLSYWKTPQDAAQALTSCYADILDANSLVFVESLSDNAYTKDLTWNDVRDVANGGYSTDHPLMKAVWDNRYAGIKRCNILLGNIDKVSGLSAQLKERYIAEARVIRAYHYFYLATFFGDVPFFTNEISIAEAESLPRTPKATITDFILKELDWAYDKLPAKDGYSSADVGRITKGAILGLKARVLLYEGGRSQEVVAVTQKLMNGEAGSYSLFNNYTGLFQSANEHNSEVILDLQYMPYRRDHDLLRWLIPPSEGGYAAISPTQELVNDYIMLNGKAIKEAGSGFDEAHPYDNRDPRLKATIVYDGYVWTKQDGSKTTIVTSDNGVNGISGPTGTTATGYYTAKYFDNTARVENGVQSGVNLIMIRYADILLMNAEAKNDLGQFDVSVWNNTIKKLRERAGFTNAGALNFPTGKTQAEYAALIQRERRCEFAMEGLRIFDIRRLHLAETVMNGWIHGIKTTNPSNDNGYIRVENRIFDKAKHYLWPIPQYERGLNKNLTQNDNWATH